MRPHPRERERQRLTSALKGRRRRGRGEGCHRWQGWGDLPERRSSPEAQLRGHQPGTASRL